MNAFELARAGKRGLVKPTPELQPSRFVSAVLAYGERFSPVALSELQRLCSPAEKLELTAALRRMRRAGFASVSTDGFVYFGDGTINFEED